MMRRVVMVGVLWMLLPVVLAAQVERGSFDSDGVRIHYQVEGTGEPVLLIHGYRASGDMNWRLPGVNRALAVDYQVITIDNRGHGKSDKPAAASDYGRNMVLDQVRLLDHLGIQSAHVAGYSMGGMITLRMLVDHPQRVRSAAICGMGWTKDDAETRARFATPPPADSNADPIMVAVRQAWGELGVSRADLAAIRVPMTTIVGESDGLYERSVVPMREVRPDIPLVLIEGATHSGAPLKPAFRQALRSWFDQQSGGAAPGPGGAESEAVPGSPAAAETEHADVQAARVPWARFDQSIIRESSALQKSRQYDNVFWTLNDSGNAAAIYALTDQGDLLASFEVDGVDNVDWESLALDDASRLYIGDIGNNSSRRRDLVVYVVDEPDLGALVPGSVPPVLEVIDRLEFSYAEQAQPPDGSVRDYDSEAIFWSEGSLYLLTKERDRTGTALYWFDTDTRNAAVLRHLGRFDFGEWTHSRQGTATAADVSADGRYLAVLGYRAIFIFSRPHGDGEQVNYLAAEPQRIALDPSTTKQCEGLAWDGDDLLLSNEQGELHRLVSPVERGTTAYP